jgi:hypothetical protein
MLHDEWNIAGIFSLPSPKPPLRFVTQALFVPVFAAALAAFVVGNLLLPLFFN